MPKGYEIESVWKSRGRGFQMAAIQPDGVAVHLTGQVAWDSDENIVGKGDITAQTRQCFENIRALLRAAGGELSDIVSITTYFTERSQLSAIQAVRLEYLAGARAPVSTSVMVAGLGHPDFLVELTPIAVIPKNRFVKPG
ncbi:MAG: RidA family protein [Pseudomonadota bacterium]